MTDCHAWIEAHLGRSHMPKDPRMYNVPMFPRNFLYGITDRDVREKNIMYTYNSSVISIQNGSFKLFGIDCIEVPGYDTEKRSIRKRIDFRNIRVYVIDFGESRIPEVFVFEPKFRKPRAECIEVRLKINDKCITKYFKFNKMSEQTFLTRVGSIMGLDSINYSKKKLRPQSA